MCRMGSQCFYLQWSLRGSIWKLKFNYLVCETLCVLHTALVSVRWLCRSPASVGREHSSREGSLDLHTFCLSLESTLSSAGLLCLGYTNSSAVYCYKGTCMVHIFYLWGGPPEKAVSQNRRVKVQNPKNISTFSKLLTYCFPIGFEGHWGSKPLWKCLH